MAPISSGTLCPPGLCVDEGVRNNQVQCTPCNKVIMLLKLNKRPGLPEKEYIVNSRSCSIYEENFQDELFSSYFKRPDVDKFGYDPALRVTDHSRLNAKSSVKQVELYWGFMPSDFPIENLTHPKIEPICIVEPNNRVKYFFIAALISMGLLMTLALVSMAMYYRTRFLLGKLSTCLYATTPSNSTTVLTRLDLQSIA